MKSESKDNEHKAQSLDNILFPLLITLVILFLLLAAFIIDEELLDTWDKFFGRAVLGL